MNDTYTLTLSSLIVDTPLLGTLFVGDYAAPSRPELDARVRSGDYFIMLATTLDTIAAELTEISPAATSLALAKIAEELDYVQRHYDIAKKSWPQKHKSL